MIAGLSWPRALLLLLVLWAGAVLVAYQRVESPEPLATLALGLAWLAVLSLACLGAGVPLLRSLGRQRLAAAELLVLGTAAGAGVLTAVSAVLAGLGLLRPLPVSAALVGLAAAGLRPAWRELRRLPWRLARGLRLPVGMLAVGGTLTLLVALTPSPFYDQLNYHLAFPFHWLRAGHVVTFPRHVFSFFPAGMGLLYVYPLASLGAWAAQLTHAWMAALATAAVALLATRLGGPRAGAWAAVLWALTPSVLLVATWAAADLGAAAFAACAWLALVTARREPTLYASARWWAFCGALVGLACGCKLLAAAVVAVPFAVATVLLPGRPRDRAGRLLPVVAAATATFGPWLVRNLVLTGNPVYPFLLGLLGGGPAGGGLAQQASESMLRVGLPLAEPLRVLSLSTFRPDGDAGAIGPLLLALAPLALWLAVRRRHRHLTGALAVAVGLGIVGWAIGPPHGRYALPFLAPLAVLEGVGLVAARRALPRRGRAAVDALVALVLAWNLLGGTSSIELRRLACTLRRADGTELMRQYASYWPAIDFVNERLPASARVLLVAESRAMYLDRDVELDDPFAVPRLVELARVSTSPRDIAERLRSTGVTHVLINWHEAGRMASLGGRGDYFAPLQPVERARLDAFLATELEPLFDQWPVVVLALKPR